MKKVFAIFISVFFTFTLFAQEIPEENVVETGAEQELAVELSENDEAVQVDADVEGFEEELEAEEVESEEAEEPEELELSEQEKRELAEAEATELYKAAQEEYAKREEEIKEYYLGQFKIAANRKETVAAELGMQKDLQAEQDKVRLAEEEVFKSRRTDEENAELNRRLSAVNFILSERGEEFAAKNGAEQNINAAELIKGQIWELREGVRIKAEAFNLERDALAAQRIDDINNAPFGEGETDSFGEPTRTAIQRRLNRCNDELAAAKLDEDNYLKQLKDEIAAAEKQLFSQLSAAYRVVDAGKYQTSSFTDDVVLRVGNFSGDNGFWRVKVTSGIFGYTGLIDMEFEITYEELTGKKFIPADQLSDELFQEFKNEVAFYDNIFHTNSNAVYARVSYEIKHWKETSEYRFMPTKLEIVKVGETPKVVHKETKVQSKNFINYSQEVYEVRSDDDIQKDIKRAAKIVEREQKKAGTYNPAYSYNGGNTSSLVEQKGRGAIVVSGGIFVPSEASAAIDELCAELTFGIGKYAFIGADFGIEIPFITDQIMEYGLVGGANYRFGKYFRPYIKGTVNVTNTYYGILRAGAGVDITFGLFMLNLGYDYSWNFDFNNHFNPDVDKSVLLEDDSVPCTQNQKFSFGIGIAF